MTLIYVMMLATIITGIMIARAKTRSSLNFWFCLAMVELFATAIYFAVLLSKTAQP